MARKSRVNRLKEAAPEEETPYGYPFMPGFAQAKARATGSKEEILILAGEYGRLSVEDGEDRKSVV